MRAENSRTTEREIPTTTRDSAPNVFKVVDGQFVIDTSADSEENIRATVGNCPSGALKIHE